MPERDTHPPDPGERNVPEDWDVHGGPDVTLGGYFREHNRPPGFEGVDGEPYTVSLEVEKTGDLSASHLGYLVFPRWASTGLGVTGHVETPTLATGTSRDGVLTQLGDLPLLRVKELLDQAILASRARAQGADPDAEAESERDAALDADAAPDADPQPEGDPAARNPGP